MLHKAQGIVLHNTKYADKRLITKIYTKQFGLVTANVTIGGTKGKIKQGVVQPLTQVELEISIKENKEVQQISEMKCLFVYTDLQHNFSKLCIAQFLNEMLFKCLKEQTPNEDLFHLICHTYQWLDKAEENYIDTHLYFLLELTKHLGIFPTNNYQPHSPYFDVQEGKFSSSIISFPLGYDAYQSQLFSQLFSHSILNQKKITRTERTVLLECLINYYKIQLTGLAEIKSYNVLQEIANTM